MRVLFTCFPGYGHFHPLVPLARALRDAGHAVAFATAEPFCARAEQAGFTARPAGLGEEAAVAERDRRLAATPGLANTGPGEARARLMFFDVAPSAMLADLVPLGRDWQPDLIIHDEGESAGPIAAAILGIPSVCHGFGSPLAPMASLHLSTRRPDLRKIDVIQVPSGELQNRVLVPKNKRGTSRQRDEMRRGHGPRTRSDARPGPYWVRRSGIHAHP